MKKVNKLMHEDVLLIPAYEPTQILLDIVDELQTDFSNIIVVDDGSVSSKSQDIFGFGKIAFGCFT